MLGRIKDARGGRILGGRAAQLLFSLFIPMMMTRIVTMTRAVTMTIVMVKILFSPCHAERTGAICEQPADPRDDRPQRAHRLHHRQGGIQSGRDQVEFSSFLDSQLAPLFQLKVHFVPTKYFAPQVKHHLHCLAITSVQAFKLRSHRNFI